MTALRFGPVIHAVDCRAAINVALEAETLGFDDVWLPDYVTLPYGEPFTLAGAVAQATSRIGIGTAVVLAPFRTPFQLAKAAASIDQLSGGRISLGLGLGGVEQDYAASGVEHDGRGRLMDEVVDATRRLLNGTSVCFAGRRFRFEDVTLGPAPVQERIPIWTGADGSQGLADGPLKRAARFADGFFPFLTPVDELRRGQQIVRELADAQGRDPDTIAWGVHIWTCLGDDIRDAARAAKRELGARYGETWTWPVEPELGYLLGTPQDLVDAVHRYADIGVTRFLIDPACPSARQPALLRTFADEVIPAFRT